MSKLKNLKTKFFEKLLDIINIDLGSIVSVILVAVFIGWMTLSCFLLYRTEERNKAIMVEQQTQSTFELIEHVEGGYIVCYDKETKVMYVMSTSFANQGTTEVMLNADGTPKLYDGE